MAKNSNATAATAKPKITLQSIWDQTEKLVQDLTGVKQTVQTNTAVQGAYRDARVGAPMQGPVNWGTVALIAGAGFVVYWLFFRGK